MPFLLLRNIININGTVVYLLQNCCWRRSNRVDMGKEYTRQEVSQHKSADSGGVWLIIGSSVYDVTKFLEEVSDMYLECRLLTQLVTSVRPSVHCPSRYYLETRN